jgi:hypothetical protein
MNKIILEFLNKCYARGSHRTSVIEDEEGEHKLVFVSDRIPLLYNRCEVLTESFNYHSIAGWDFHPDRLDEKLIITNFILHLSKKKKEELLLIAEESMLLEI